MRVGPQRLRPPYRVLWEITRRCDLRCSHCLVRGGAGRGDDLATDEALDLVDQIAELGAKVVSLTGGEPLLRDDWPVLGRRIRDRGLGLRLSTNGHALDDRALARLVELGVETVAVSLDGLRDTHDRLRRAPAAKGRSSFQRVLAALDRLRPTGITTQVITTVHRENLAELPALHELLAARGVGVWSIQLAHRTGRLAEPGQEASAPTLLPPSELPALARFIVDRAGDRRLAPRAHNSIGYLGKTEPLLRGAGHRTTAPRFWKGCRCGIDRLGIEPDGGIKGCANQVGAPFVVGNVRREPLRAIWQDRDRWHWLAPRPGQATSACAGCALFRVCRAGCKAMALGSTGSLFGTTHCLRDLERRAVGERA